MEVVNKVKRTLAGRIYCGFAGGYRAVLGDRWTPLVIREIMVGASVQGVPKAASVLYPRNVHRWPVNAPKDTRGLQFAKSSDAGFRRPVPHRHPFGWLVSHRAGCLTGHRQHQPTKARRSPQLVRHTGARHVGGLHFSWTRRTQAMVPATARSSTLAGAGQRVRCRWVLSLCEGLLQATEIGSST